MKSIILTRTMLPMRVNPCGSDLLGTRGAPDDGMPARNDDAPGLQQRDRAAAGAAGAAKRDTATIADDVSAGGHHSDGSCAALHCCRCGCTHAARLWLMADGANGRDAIELVTASDCR